MVKGEMENQEEEKKNDLVSNRLLALISLSFSSGEDRFSQHSL